MVLFDNSGTKKEWNNNLISFKLELRDKHSVLKKTLIGHPKPKALCRECGSKLSCYFPVVRVLMSWLLKRKKPNSIQMVIDTTPAWRMKNTLCKHTRQDSNKQAF